MHSIARKIRQRRDHRNLDRARSSVSPSVRQELVATSQRRFPNL